MKKIIIPPAPKPTVPLNKPELSHRNVQLVGAEEKKAEGNPLDKLFQKTQFKPCLYFLPNMDETLLKSKREELLRIK